MILAPDHFLLTCVLFSLSMVVLWMPSNWWPSFVTDNFAINWADMPSGLRGVAIPARVSAAQRRTPDADLASRRVGKVHIDRLCQIVGAAVDAANIAEQLHRTAHQQVDAAHYALQNLYAELAGVMPGVAASLPTQLGPTRANGRAPRSLAVAAIAA